jgi:hypothetical protein
MRFPSASRSPGVVRTALALGAVMAWLMGGAPGGARLAQAQTPPPPSTRSTGTLSGTVRAAQTGTPLPYAVVSIPALALERFSGANGFFVLTDVPAGTHAVTVRRIGFVPQQSTVTITAGAVTTLDAPLVQIPVRLTSLIVRPVEPCKNPGLPDAARFPEVAQLVGLLRENAATYRTLARQHPYAYAQFRALGTLTRDSIQLASIVAERIEGVNDARYRPGRVVTTTGRGFSANAVMALPTVLDLVDPAFIANHCFRYGGSSANGNETWVRLDVRAADKLRSPDVHGAFYLDSATAQLRRMELDLSRVDRLPAALRGIRAVQATTTFLEIAPGLSIIDNVCAINWLTPTRRVATPLHPAELQHVAAVRFENPPPDIPALREFPRPSWSTGLRLARSALSCAEQP